MMNYPGDNDAVAIWSGKSRKFSDPFLLPSSDAIPTELQSALDFCLYLYYLNPLYRRASMRVISHFVTDIEFEGKDGDQDERDEFKSYLINDLDLFGVLLEIGQEWSCFQGDTRVVTKNGVYPIKDLTGKTVDVLSAGGVYRPATFKSYGEQELLEVEFNDGRKIYATPEHQWYASNTDGKEIVVTTTQLKKRYKIQRTVASRPEKDAEYCVGLQHGIVFGATRQIGLAVQRNTGYEDVLKEYGATPEYKNLPATEKSASYWYGFVSGVIQTAGTVDSQGRTTLTQTDVLLLEEIAVQLPRIGMCAGPIRVQGSFVDPNTNVRVIAHSMPFLRRFMDSDDFASQEHRERFISNKEDALDYGKYSTVKAVKKANRREEVFCCEENETHSFVVDTGIITSNCYGNAFLRIHLPFDRVLIDNRNGKYKEYALSMFGSDIKYIYKTMQYDVPDPEAHNGTSFDKKNGGRVCLNFLDRPCRNKAKIKLRKLDPRQIVLQHSFLSGKQQIIYRFEPEFVTLIKNGVMYQVNETPMSMLKAIAEDQDFLFNEGQVFHFKAPSISGISNFGWGLPETIANYRHVHQLQVLRKIDEAVGMDYMLPFRLFHPDNSGQANDPLNYMLLSRWGSEIKTIIKNRRADPFAMHALPFPVTYQEFGAQGKSLAPKELVEYHNNVLLDAMGYPAELFKGSLQIQQVPTAVRLFENSFHFVHQGFDRIVKWVARRVTDFVGQQQLDVTLQLPRMADDLERQNIYMQLSAGAEIPRSIAYGPFGIKDPVEAAKQRAQEDMEIQKEQAELKAEFDRQMTVGSMDAVVNSQGQQAAGTGSSPSDSGMGAGTPMTPMDIQQQAEQLAQQLLQMPIGERQKQMAAVKASNPNLHALAKQKMEDMRSQAASQGKESLSQPAQ